MRTLTKRQHEDGKGKSTISNVARVRKKTRTHEGHGGKAVKRGMPMKSVKLMKFTKPVKKKDLEICAHSTTKWQREVCYRQDGNGAQKDTRS